MSDYRYTLHDKKLMNIFSKYYEYLDKSKKHTGTKLFFNSTLGQKPINMTICELRKELKILYNELSDTNPELLI